MEQSPSQETDWQKLMEQGAAAVRAKMEQNAAGADAQVAEAQQREAAHLEQIAPAAKAGAAVVRHLNK